MHTPSHPGAGAPPPQTALDRVATVGLMAEGWKSRPVSFGEHLFRKGVHDPAGSCGTWKLPVPTCSCCKRDMMTLDMTTLDMLPATLLYILGDGLREI